MVQCPFCGSNQIVPINETYDEISVNEDKLFVILYYCHHCHRQFPHIGTHAKDKEE